MKILKKCLALSLVVSGLLLSMTVQAEESPDALVQRISQEVLAAAKADKHIKSGDNQHIRQLVEDKIVPHIDFDLMTRSAVGSAWRTATPQQQAELTQQFRNLLISTYSSVLSKAGDQQIIFEAMRGDSSDNKVVRSKVLQPGGEPIQLNYRLQNTGTGTDWKIYDVNISGVWLIQTYRSSFQSEVNKPNGIDGLIETLSKRNSKNEQGNSTKK